MTHRHLRRTGSLATLVLATLALMPGLAAALGAYSLDIETDAAWNTSPIPRFTLTNLSTAGEEIVDFSITLGDREHFVIDFVLSPESAPSITKAEHLTELGTGARLVLGDRVNDGFGTSTLTWSFWDFHVGEQLVFAAEITPTATGTASLGARLLDVDPRLGLLSADGLGTGLVRVEFSDGSVAETRFEHPDEMMPESFHLFGEGRLPPNVSPVPEPGAALLFGIGLLSVSWGRSRRTTD